MTAPDVVDLGRRAVACAGWRWVPGTACLDGLRIDGVDSGGRPYRAESYGDEFGERVSVHRYGEDDPLPNLTDAATLGALLGLVREAWGPPSVYVRPDLWMPDGSRTWAVCGLPSTVARLGYTSEAAALVAALEAAPVRS